MKKLYRSYTNLRLIVRPNSVQDGVEVAVEPTLDVVRPARAAVGLVGDGHEPHLVDRLGSSMTCFFSEVG